VAITADDVRNWLKLEPGTSDDAVIDAAVAATNAWVAQTPYVANLANLDPPVVDWPADATLGATMLAARWYRRRNTPAGIEAFTDNVVYLPRRDGDVDYLLHLTRPALG
jgi:hypothetical protein